eukprot:1982186-Pyramimonas_sp.AAC.1
MWTCMGSAPSDASSRSEPAFPLSLGEVEASPPLLRASDACSRDEVLVAVPAVVELSSELTAQSDVRPQTRYDFWSILRYTRWSDANIPSTRTQSQPVSHKKQPACLPLSYIRKVDKASHLNHGINLHRLGLNRPIRLTRHALCGLTLYGLILFVLARFDLA